MLIQILLMSLLSLFYIIYFIKMLILKKQGIKGNLLGKGSKSKKALRIELILKTNTWIGAVIQFGSVVFPALIWSFPVSLPVQITGVVLSGISIVFFTLSVTVMRNNWRAGFDEKQNTKLVTGGIYRFSRNPAFVGFDLLYIGCAISFPNIINILAALTAFLSFHFQILSEEKFLAYAFGKPYMDYKAKVRRYI